MEQFIARQPIFDADLKVKAYELLCRNGDSSCFNLMNGDAATSQVISQSLLGDISKIVADKKVYINFTEQIIVDEIALMLDKNRLVVEVLEDVEPTEKVINALSKIKLLGYTIALDDIVSDLPDERLIKLADIAKVDFAMTKESDRKKIVAKLKRYNLTLLAEKIEDMNAYREAVKMGFDLFQGYFFAKPDLVRTKELRPLKVNHLQLLSELHKEVPSFDVLTNIVESDVTLSYKLLKLINSAAFYRQAKIQNINQALVMLGIKELRKWMTLVVLQEVGQDKPDELFKVALIRGKIIEMLCDVSGLTGSHQGFLVGLMSLIDIMTDREMPQILRELPLDHSITNALLEREDILGQLLSLVEHYEESRWDYLEDLATELKIDIQQLPFFYFDALEWTELLIH